MASKTQKAVSVEELNGMAKKTKEHYIKKSKFGREQVVLSRRRLAAISGKNPFLAVLRDRERLVMNMGGFISD